MSRRIILQEHTFLLNPTVPRIFPQGGPPGGARSFQLHCTIAFKIGTDSLTKLATSIYQTQSTILVFYPLFPFFRKALIRFSSRFTVQIYEDAEESKKVTTIDT